MADNKPTKSGKRATPTGATVTVAVGGEHDVFAAAKTLAEQLDMSVSEYQRLAIRAKNEAVVKELAKGDFMAQVDARHAESYGKTLSESMRDAKARARAKARLDAAMERSGGKLTEAERRRALIRKLTEKKG